MVIRVVIRKRAVKSPVGEGKKLSVGVNGVDEKILKIVQEHAQEKDPSPFLFQEQANQESGRRQGERMTPIGEYTVMGVIKKTVGKGKVKKLGQVGNEEKEQHHGKVGNHRAPEGGPVALGLIFSSQKGHVQDGVAGGDHGALSI